MQFFCFAKEERYWVYPETALVKVEDREYYFEEGGMVHQFKEQDLVNVTDARGVFAWVRERS